MEECHPPQRKAIERKAWKMMKVEVGRHYD
jgi:hypothetical protein